MASRSIFLRNAELPFVVLFNRLVAPLVVVAALVVLELLFWGQFSSEWVVLSVFAFLLSSQAFAELNALRLLPGGKLGIDVRRLLLAWAIVVGGLLFLGYATKTSGSFSRRVLFTWVALTPVLLLFTQIAFSALLQRTRSALSARSAVIVGAGELGYRLAGRIGQHNFIPLRLDGFFDDRSAQRLPVATRSRLAGTLEELPDFVRQRKINNIYITLPMAAQPRTIKLLDALQDTTASIYFVPDVGRFNLVQTHLDEVGDMPVIGVSDTPFFGANAIIKRAFDIAMASVCLLALAPLMFTIALCVRLSSKGPAIFRQRRYGLDGEEIIVYKFRTMTVCEDGPVVEQAKQGDARVTRLGAFLRRSSLDELPQLVNVLQGRMSLVGPRPHAVAHNELYRKLIKGYMLRHKVRPGITGWAQVHGLRGETETVDKMERRVRYDMEYIRNWSVLMDVKIILRTAALIYRDRAAH
jgi:putative colanic acid biosysnthesis UDP-glucose lipid carrier transferase